MGSSKWVSSERIAPFLFKQQFDLKTNVARSVCIAIEKTVAVRVLAGSQLHNPRISLLFRMLCIVGCGPHVPRHSWHVLEVVCGFMACLHSVTDNAPFTVHRASEPRGAVVRVSVCVLSNVVPDVRVRYQHSRATIPFYIICFAKLPESVVRHRLKIRGPQMPNGGIASEATYGD